MARLTKGVWHVAEDDFPSTSPLEAQLGFLLRYAILAPSARNSQPWAFSVQQDRIHVIADLRRCQAVGDADRRELSSAWAAPWRTCWWRPSTLAFGMACPTSPSSGTRSWWRR